MIESKTVRKTIKMSHEEVISSAKSLAPLLRKRGQDADILRSQPKETIDAIVDSGLIRILQPEKFGGHELHINSLTEATMELAKGDPSAGWCFTLLGLHSFMLAGWPEEAQKIVWGENPNALISSAFALTGKARKADGGYYIEGEWPFSSGVDHSDWAMVSSAQPPLEKGQNFRHLMFLVNRKDFEIEDDWNVSGIKGSGSKKIVIKEEIFVPNYMVCDIAKWSKLSVNPGISINNNSMYKLPLLTIIPFFLASVILGSAKGAYEIWVDNARKKATAYTNKIVSSYTHQQIRLAEYSAQLASVEALFRNAVEEVTNSDGILPQDLKVRLGRDYAYTAKVSAEVVQKLFYYSGAGAIYESNPMQRFWRDIQVMTMHAGLNFDFVGENFGRVELGLGIPPENPYV